MYIFKMITPYLFKSIKYKGLECIYTGKPIRIIFFVYRFKLVMYV